MSKHPLRHALTSSESTFVSLISMSEFNMIRIITAHIGSFSFLDEAVAVICNVQANCFTASPLVISPPLSVLQDPPGRTATACSQFLLLCSWDPLCQQFEFIRSSLVQGQVELKCLTWRRCEMRLPLICRLKDMLGNWGCLLARIPVGEAPANHWQFE